MRIRFQDKWIRDICERSKEAQIEFGEDAAYNLRTILSDIESVESVEELCFREPVFAIVDGIDSVTINLTNKFILRFIPVNILIRNTPKGNISWGEVDTIKIIKIGTRDE